MAKRTIIFLLLLISGTLIYLFFRKSIEAQWGNFEIYFTLLSYWTSILLFWYNSDLKFHFLVNRLLLFFKHDHTTWLISSRYVIKDIDNIVSLNSIEDYLRTKKYVLKTHKKDGNYMELLLDNKYLLHFKLQQFELDAYELHFYTSKIIVPTKQNKNQIREIIAILEDLEGVLHLKIFDKKMYDIDIEYPNKSPYYSYWIRKLPEEMISSFNFSLILPDINDKVSVNKNHLLIKSDKYSKLFQLATDYVSLKSVA